jgi:uncharacterized protein YccT (UPF0319 family)
MSERLNFFMLAVLACCVAAAAFVNITAESKDIILAVVNGVIGAIGGYGVHAATHTSVKDGE